jgi:hypothetical protein
VKRTKIVIAFLTLLSLNVWGQTKNTAFIQIYDLIEQKNFFKAKEIYDLQKKDLSDTHQKFLEAFLDNAFNRLDESNNQINQLIKAESNLPDSLILELYKIKEDNYVKLFDYKEAKNALITILKDYKDLLSENEINGIENSLKIWSALENEPKQKTFIKDAVRLKIEKDKVGLNNLKVSKGKDSLNFIFDTGANLSTVSKSTAQQFGMKIIPVDIEVGTITGEKVPAQIAVCPEFKLDNIEILNSIFLVLDDNALAFPQIDYQIYGVLGFPVIEALREIQITRDGYFIVPKEETKNSFESNMAMDGLTPLIYINQRHFTFDTGADRTLFYHSYYIENQKEIDKNYKPEKISFGGAAGRKEFDGYVISVNINILDKEITLKDIQLLKEKIKDSETVYGNIGQDLIKQFHKMTMNFDRMFIKFD